MPKIIKQLREYSSSHGPNSFNAEIMNFSSPQEFEDHLFYHGTGGSVSGGLSAGFRHVRNERGGGGGYGEKYYSISLSKNKNVASDFTGDSRYGVVYPVILKKGAKVISMPQFQDANELEELLPQLWDQGVDAVKIGDWSHRASEQELVVLNPKAIHIGNGESFSVFQKQRFQNPTKEEIEKMWIQSADTYKNWMESLSKKMPFSRVRSMENFNKNKESFLRGKNELV